MIKFITYEKSLSLWFKTINIAITHRSEMLGSKHDADSEDITIKQSTYNNLFKAVIAGFVIAAFLGGYSVGTMDDSGSGITNEELKLIVQGLDNKVVRAPVPAAAPAAAPQPTPSGSTLISVSVGDDPFKGNADAPVIVVEFSDFQCPFCKRFVDQTLGSLEEEYIDTGKVKFVFKDFPLTNLHPNVTIVHIASECANEQGKFWEYHDMLFAKQDDWKNLTPENLKSELKMYATTLGLSGGIFESCLSSQKIADEVATDFLHAGIYGATGTPTFFIGNEKDGFVMLVGAKPFANFKGEIDRQLG